MRKRPVLALCAVGVLALLAGCSAAGSIDMEPVNRSELVDDASRSLEPEPWTRGGSERPPSAVARGAITNGSTTVVATSPPVREGLPFEFEGAYYDLSRAVVDQRRASVVSIEINYNATDANGTAIAYDDLPAADRDALRAVLPPKMPPRSDGADFGAGAIYTDAELDASVLASDQRYDAVVYDGERYPITVGDPESVTVATYRYEAATVAPNASAYATQLREAYEFTLSNLTDAERSVLEEAAGEGTYYAESADDAAFESVLDRFRAHEAVVHDQASGTWIVRYEGDLYLADLRYGGFLAE